MFCRRHLPIQTRSNRNQINGCQTQKDKQEKQTGRLVQTTCQRPQGTLKEKDPGRSNFKVDETDAWCHPTKSSELGDCYRPSSLTRCGARQGDCPLVEVGAAFGFGGEIGSLNLIHPRRARSRKGPGFKFSLLGAMDADARENRASNAIFRDKHNGRRAF